MTKKEFSKLETGDIVLMVKRHRLAKFNHFAHRLQDKGYFYHLDTNRCIYRGARQIERIIVHSNIGA